MKCEFLNVIVEKNFLLRTILLGQRHFVLAEFVIGLKMILLMSFQSIPTLSEIGKVEVEKTTSSFTFTEEVFLDVPRLDSKG